MRLASVSLAVALVVGGVAGCSSSPGTAPSPSADPRTDKLAQVLARGTILLSTDPVYAPQSFAVEGATRQNDTKCAANALTAPEMDGFDVATGKAAAAKLGVEPCFVVPTWTEITGGNWGDRWDVAWGNGGINGDRMTRLYMTQPYLSDLQRFYVREDSPYQALNDLDGKQVGACASCTHELYLRNELTVPGVEIVQKVKDPVIVTFEVEGPGLQAVVDGEIDAFLLSEGVGDAAIADGLPLRALEEPAFRLYTTGFLDRSSRFDQVAFLDRVNAIVRELHADGTLLRLSKQFHGKDYVSAAAAFDLDSIHQQVP